MPISDTGRRPWGDFWTQVSTGQIPGAIPLCVIGENSNLTGNPTGGQDIWEGPTDAIPIPDPTGVSLEIVSNDSNDTLLGSGANLVQFYYIDTSGAEVISSPMALNGLTPVDTGITDCVYINSFFVVQAGNVTIQGSAVAIGEVHLRDSSTGTVYSLIGPNGNQSLACSFMVPASKMFIVGVWSTSITGTKVGSMRIRATATERGTSVPVFLFKDTFKIANGYDTAPFPAPFPVMEGDIVKISGFFPAAGGASAGAASFHGAMLNAP